MTHRHIAAVVTLSLAGVVAGIGAPRSASACSPPSCVVNALPFDGQTLPAKVRALPFSGGAAPVLTLGGVVVPSTIEALADHSSVILPDAPLADGTYALTYTPQCAAKPKATATFDVGAVVAEPHTSGTLLITKRFVAGIKNAPEPNLGACELAAIAYDHVVADVAFTPAAELASYLSLTRFSADLAASNLPWKTSFAVSPAATTPTVVASFSASCEANPPLSGNTPPGVYTMSVAGQIAGADGALATSTAAIDLTCPAGSGSSGSADSGGGCAIGAPTGHSPARGLAAVGLGAAALAGVVRRRRRLA